ncbi:MAG: ArsR/SmtB family transcription factor [Reyranellaceae bacterium]
MNDVLTALKAVGEETRLRILALCARDQINVTDLTQILGQSQPRVSRHLKLMTDAGLLERFREGPFAYFRLKREGDAARLAQAVVQLLPQGERGLESDRRRLQALKEQREHRIASYFRDNAPEWHRLRSLHVDDSKIERVLVGLLREKPARALLDIGTGTGRVLEVLAPHFQRGIGIDQSHEMLSLARANLARAGVHNAEVRQGSMYALGLPDDSFDVVTLHQVLHYAEDPQAVLEEAARVLQGGGRLIVVDFAPHELVHLQREHAHRHLGFADNQVAGWMAAAGLVAGSPRHLPGERLDVGIWVGERPPETARAGALSSRAHSEARS